MQKITNLANLMYSIELLEEKDLNEGILLREHFNQTLDGFQPVNIIKNTLNDIANSSDIKRSISDILLGITSGAVAKNILVGETHNPISKITGVLVEMIVAKNVTENAEKIKSFGINILHKFLHRGN